MTDLCARRRAIVMLAVILMAGSMLGGCAGTEPFRGMRVDESGVLITGLPPITQTDGFACGPASLASVVQYWGRPWPADFDGPEFEGSEIELHKPLHNADELVEMAEATGLRAVAYVGSKEDLEEHLRHGRPVIVMILPPPDPHSTITRRLVTAVYSISPDAVPGPGHWVVAKGIDGNGDIIVHDPRWGGTRIRRQTFDQWWSARARLSVLVSPEADRLADPR